MVKRLQRQYQRKRPSADPEPAILVVTEGTKTEPKYLEALRELLHLTATRVEVCPAPGTDPGSIVRCAISMREERRREAKHGDSIPYGEVWIVFDSEDRLGTPELNSAVAAARQKGLKIAMSSPCFEYWLILHFEYTTRYMCTFQEVERRLKRHIPDYDKSSPPTEVLLSKIADAVDHAARCRIEQDKAASEIPRTDVDLLVRVMDTATRNHHRIPGQASGA